MSVCEVLLIEDEKTVRIAPTQTLQLGGFAVHACDSAEQVQKWLEPGFPGVVVTDVHLAGRSGLDVLVHFRIGQHRPQERHLAFSAQCMLADMPPSIARNTGLASRWAALRWGVAGKVARHSVGGGRQEVTPK
ncbi:response regulator [Noviherbaspirillum sp.]|uniref:response regulator n=1 Tax=Noviherbaspirillum sp. TaxID=1926288 RepID=UPI002FE412C5